MPALSQEQWNTIQVRYENGETVYALAKDFPVSRQAIMKRAAKRGWRVPTGQFHDAVQNLPTTRRITDPQTRSDKLLAAYGKRTPENTEKMLDYIHDGLSESMAAKSVGISPATLTQWKKDDPELEMLLNQARNQCLAKQVKSIHNAGANGDWKAASWLVERAPETREEYFLSRNGQGGGASITLNVNVPVPQPLEPGEKAKTIDAHAQRVQWEEAREAGDGN